MYGKERKGLLWGKVCSGRIFFARMRALFRYCGCFFFREDESAVPLLRVLFFPEEESGVPLLRVLFFREDESVLLV